MLTVLSGPSLLREIINSPPSPTMRTRRVRTGINQFKDPFAARAKYVHNVSHWATDQIPGSVCLGCRDPNPRVWVPTLQIETFRRLARLAKRLAFGVILRFCVVKRVQFNLLRYLI